jgi:hypothetical protein
VAILFDDAASQYLLASGALVTAVPLSIAAWFNSDDLTIDQIIFAINVAGSNDNAFALQLSGSVAGDPVSALARTTASSAASTSSAYSTGVWQHAAAVFASATSRSAYLNGGSKGTNAVSRVPAGLNQMCMGARRGATTLLPFSGMLAEVGVWNIALTDADVLALSTGISPLAVQPEYLVHYYRAIGQSAPEIDLVNGYGLSWYASPTGGAAHPRVFGVPSGFRIGVPYVSVSTIPLNLLSIASVAQHETSVPGAVAKVMALLSLAGAPLAETTTPGAVVKAMTLLNMAGASLGETVTPGAISKAMALLSLTGMAQTGTVTPGAVALALDLLGLTGAAETETNTPGAVSKALALLTLASSGKALTVTPGAVSKAMNLLTLAGVAQDLTVTPGAVSLALDLLELTGDALDLTVAPGTVALALNLLGLTGAALHGTITPGGIALTLDLLGLTGETQGLTVTPGAVALVLDLLGLTGAALHETTTPGAIALALDLLGLTGAAQAETTTPGAVSLAMDLLGITGAVYALIVYRSNVGIEFIIGMSAGIHGIGMIPISRMGRCPGT